MGFGGLLKRIREFDAELQIPGLVPTKQVVRTSKEFFTVDYPSQELLAFRQGRIEGVDGNPAEVRYSLDVDTRRVFVRRTEPLVLELEHFVETVRGRCPNEVDGRQAFKALELVWGIREYLQGLAAADD